MSVKNNQIYILHKKKFELNLVYCSKTKKKINK